MRTSVDRILGKVGSYLTRRPIVGGSPQVLGPFPPITSCAGSVAEAITSSMMVMRIDLRPNTSTTRLTLMAGRTKSIVLAGKSRTNTI